MTALVVIRLLHVCFAVLGAGAVGSIAIAARAATRADGAATLLLSLTRLAGAGFGGTILTGAALDWATGGAYHELWWFRLAGLSTIASGVIVGLIRRRASRATANPDGLRATPALAYAACALVAWIVVLMELRPFG